MLYTSREVRQKFLDFYASKGHAIIPSASLVPKEDPTVLFNTAGMQPLLPYLLGQATHPEGARLVDSQKCVRTGDLEEAGDNRHLTFFEMLGSWSIGDYFKQESIEWGWELLTSKEYFGIDPKRLYVTVYQGNGGDIGADKEAIEVWRKMFAEAGIEADVGIEYNFAEPKSNPQDAKYVYRITKRSGKDNWWGLPYRGPAGPCSEIYYLLNSHELEGVDSRIADMSPQDAAVFVENEIVEIWNHVFMQYEAEKTDQDEPKDYTRLASNNVDTGMGFERLLTVLNGYETVYQTDVLAPLVAVVDRHIQS
jgi:alanyl-tRNA synthetase